MRQFLLAAAVALFALPAMAEDGVINFSSDDPEMNAAIGRARAALPTFWERHGAQAANEDSFALKLGISDGDNTEHFWCGSIEGNATRATCTIDNDPVYVFTVSLGQRVEVDPAIISDWMYYRDGLIVGGETIRVMVTRMPEDEAAYYRDMLADPGAATPAAPARTNSRR